MREVFPDLFRSLAKEHIGGRGAGGLDVVDAIDSLDAVDQKGLEV
jgi:hypothetical protein